MISHSNHWCSRLKTAFPWERAAEWHRAGGRLHQLQGLVVYEPVARGPHEPPRHFAQGVWKESYEAEAHLAHLGLSQEPVCWTLCGFASGYLSCCHGRTICCIEERCRGKGDAVCQMAGRPTEEWGDDVRPSLVYFQPDAIQETLGAVTRQLKRAERRLASRSRELDRVKVREAETGLVAESEAMRRVLDFARRVARRDAALPGGGRRKMGRSRRLLCHFTGGSMNRGVTFL